jgi:hypothetical protein
MSEGHAQCTKCWITHPHTAEFFPRDASRKSGLRRRCRMCAAEDARVRYGQLDKAKLAQQKRQYEDKNRGARREWQARWREANIEKTRVSNKKWRDSHPGARTNYKRKWLNENPDKCAEYSRRYKDKDPERYRAKQARQDVRRRANVKYALHSRISRAIRKALQGGKAGRKWEILVGYTCGRFYTSH